MVIERVIEEAIRLNATDIHLTCGKLPAFRILGEIEYQNQFNKVDLKDLLDFLKNTCKDDAEEIEKLSKGERIEGIDSSFTLKNRRFRANIYLGLSGLSVALRLLNDSIPTIDELELPMAIHKIPTLKKGLVLVAGTTGSGKSTTLASILNEVNKNTKCRIITIEDPIEYIYTEENANIEQREVNKHTKDFKTAIIEAMRQDPDVMLVGEMRDIQTVENAIIAAETGHLVLGTIHADGVLGVIDRVIGIFPEGKQGEIRTELANVLQCVIYQRLVVSNIRGRVPLCEVMFVDDTIRHSIKENKNLASIRDRIAFSKDSGSVSIVDSALTLYQKGHITVERLEGLLGQDDLSRLKNIIIGRRNS